MKQIILLSLLASAAVLGFFTFQKQPDLSVTNFQDGDSDDGYYSVNLLFQYSSTSLEAYLIWVPGKTFVDDLTNPVVKQLKLTLNFDNYNELSFKISDFLEERFNLPYREPFPYTKVTQDPSKESLFEYVISVPGDQFYFKLWRKDTGEVIFDTTDFPLIFKNEYLEITTKFSNSAIFGLGERRTTFKLSSGDYTIWAADAARIDYGYPGQQIYGTHPMYLRRDDNTHNSHIVFLRNAYGMQLDYVENKRLTYRVIGGNFDFKIFVGDKDVEAVLKLYHNYINGWILHPFWVQGYHQCRWGYNTSQDLQNVWDKFNQLSIPIDSLWSDIDYMYQFYDFTVDVSRFNLTQMREIYDMSKPQGVHWSSIIDVGIALGSDAAVRGQQLNTFIKSGETGQDLVGNVWPGNTYYPDFNHPNSTEYWYEGLVNITKNYGLLQEGIWIDMNEFSNFVNGEVLPSTSSESSGFLQENESHTGMTNVPYNPQGYDALDVKTLSLNAYHYNKEDAVMLNIPAQNLTQFDMHNLNGFGEGIATYKAAKKMGHNLTFILSRSTLFGSGKYVQHWNGDGFSEWDYLKFTIPGIINFQMYGIPFVGDDICGLNGNATAQLCARWMQLGSLYPFARNHNGNESSPQEPYAFPRYEYVLSSSIKTLNVRYSLLKYYYHLFVKGNGLGTVFRPLIWEFPDDDNSLTQETQFFIGDTLMAAPVTYSGNDATNTTGLNIYFPQNGVFYDFYNQVRYTSGSVYQNVRYDDVVPLYLRAGKIVHVQQPELRSRFLNNNFTLQIALDNNLTAAGSILTINDYNDQENIINNCLGEANCVALLSVKGVFKDSTTFVLTIISEGEKDNTTFQQIFINQVIVSGISFNSQFISKTIDISSKPFEINQDLQKYSITIPLS